MKTKLETTPTNHRGGRPKGYKMSEATKRKLRAAWRRRKEANTTLVARKASKRRVIGESVQPADRTETRAVAIPVSLPSIHLSNGKASIMITDRREAVEILSTLAQFLA